MKLEIIKDVVIRFVPENSKDCFDLGVISTKLPNESHFLAITQEPIELKELETSIEHLINFIALAKVDRKI